MATWRKGRAGLSLFASLPNFAFRCHQLLHCCCCLQSWQQHLFVWSHSCNRLRRNSVSASLYRNYIGVLNALGDSFLKEFVLNALFTVHILKSSVYILVSLHVAICELKAEHARGTDWLCRDPICWYHCLIPRHGMLLECPSLCQACVHFLSQTLPKIF